MQIIKSFSIYTLASILTSGVSFLLLPYLASHLTPAEYGLTALFNTYVAILVPIVSMLTYSYLSVEYFKLGDKNKLAELVSTLHLFPLSVALLALCVFAAIREPLTALLELPATASISWVLALPVFALVINYNELFAALLIIEKKASFYALLSVVRAAFEAALTIMLISYAGLGWEGRIYAWLGATAALMVVGLVALRRRGLLKFRWSWHFCSASLALGLPLVLHAIGKYTITQSDRLFLTKMVSLYEMGIYNVGYQLGSIILVLCTAFSNSFAPFLYERLAQPSEQGRKEIRAVGMSFVAALLLVAVAIVVLAPWFLRTFVPTQYGASMKYIPWIVLSYWFWGVYLVFSGYLFFFKQVRFLTILAIINVVANVALNYVFIHRFGAVGAAYATASSYFLIMILVIAMVGRIRARQGSSGEHRFAQTPAGA